MKKLILLLVFAFSASIANAQTDTLYFENFDQPSGPDKVTTLGKNGAKRRWSDTTNVAVSPSASYRGRVSNSVTKEVIFRTDTFNTFGYKFVFLDWQQIAKLRSINRGLIRVSTDGGQSWTQVDSSNSDYIGGSVNFSQLGWFNESSYTASAFNLDVWEVGKNQPVQNSWWRKEKLDISELVLDTPSAGKGLDSVQIEFVCQFLANPTGIIGEGWYVDNLTVTASTCELFPPQFDFNYAPQNPRCFLPRPQGAQNEEPTKTYYVGARINDSVPNQKANDRRYSGLDSAWVIYRVKDSLGNVGPWKKVPMLQQGTRGDEYLLGIDSINIGDTVDYYYRARDLSCPNITRVPDSAAAPYYYSFWPIEGVPPKCGAPFCGQAPGTISNFPWLEDFESSDWTAGSGNGASGTLHRGDFPNEQRGQNYWQVAPGEGQPGYGWSVRTGGTDTKFTGPTGNHTPGGNKYIYTEASQGSRFDNTNLITPCIDLTSSTSCKQLEFYYHFFGEDIGNLRVDIDTGSNTSSYWLNYGRIKKEQQTSQNDPWRRALLDLTPFNGKYIRIRFASVRTANQGDDRGDMAIDDLRIYNPGNKDAELTQYVEPIDGSCSYSSSEKVKVILRNAACDTLQSVPIKLEVSGPGGTSTQTETANVNLGLGDTTLYTLTNTADLSSLGGYQIKVYTDLPNDPTRDNDTVVSDSIIHKAAFSSFPYIEDFDNAGAEGTQNFGSPVFISRTGLDPFFQWSVGEELTSTRNTGPWSGYYKDGKYVYTEATGSSGNVETYLESDMCLDFSGMSNPTLDFYYHTYGADIEKIEVQSSDFGDVWTTISNSRVNANQQNHPTDEWKFKRVDLSSLANTSAKLRIVGFRKGSGGEADMAVDKIMIYDRISSDAGVEYYLRPNLAAPANDTFNILPPQLQVRNFGTSSLSNVNVEVSVTPLCGPNKGVSKIFTPSNTTGNLGAGNAVTFNMNNLDLVIPTGECRICAYTTGISGDNLAFNDTACRNIVGNATFPITFKDNFDSCDYDRSGFFAQKGLLQWQLGTPSFGNITSPQSSPNAWVTDLDGAYLTGTEEVLRTPVMANFDTVFKPTIKFFQNVDMGAAEGAFEARINPDWESVAGTNSGVNIARNQGQNWYFSPFGSLGLELFSNEPGFTGGSQGWKLSVFPLNQFNLDSERQFRFRMISKSGTNTNRSGWGIDDYEMFVPPQNSASPTRGAFVNPLPFPRQPQNFRLRIANTGAKLLEETLVRVEMDPNTANAWTGPNDSIDVTNSVGLLIENDDFGYNYTGTWPANLVTSGAHNLRVRTSRPNHEMDNRPIDDTLSVEVDVLNEFQFDVANGDTLYCNDFEPNNGAFPFITLNTFTFQKYEIGKDANGNIGIIDTLTSWQLGPPQQIDSAASGKNVWMTHLDKNYELRDQSSLITPIFLIDTNSNYKISFDHWFNTEKFHDGGTVELSLDAGRTWRVVGSEDHPDWFNTDFVTALDIIKPGWTDTSGGWIHSENVLSFDSTYQAVFRFRFESDYAIERAGWAIDNFCFHTTNERDNYFVGEEEIVSTEPEMIIGRLNPNPAQHETNLPIHLPSAADARIEVYNILGQPVTSEKVRLQPGENNHRIDTYGWQRGVYMVEIHVNGKTETRKLLIGK